MVRFDYAKQPKETVSACNLCGGQEFASLHRLDRYGFQVRQCSCTGCGLRFLSPRMTAQAYRRFYEKGHYRSLLSHFYGRSITAESIEQEQAEYAERLVALLAAHLDGLEMETLLDVGGSTGVVAAAISYAFDLDATVLEPSRAEAERAAERGLRVIHGTIEDLEPADKYDVILLCQTIDHLIDIRGALRTLRHMLNEGGLFFVDVVLNGPVKIDHPYDLSEECVLHYLAMSGFNVLTSGPAGDGLHHNFICGGSCWHPQ